MTAMRIIYSRLLISAILLAAMIASVRAAPTDGAGTRSDAAIATSAKR